MLRLRGCLSDATANRAKAVVLGTGNAAHAH
jgi:NH3-dependent NAD+ synthetase